ncbi:MAG: selenium metabolism-associated LysR family transcriptional regulator [Dissulfurispiraceae bacterium]|jgi:DNA-binding transcriptional LysR family regulator|nr:selenium metabolism-associated LysR family transcriptional regulator [Dissulfurispiraceae bacterium]
MGLEDHKLKVFCTVAETKSFSKTSEIIYLTQPAVSLQVQALEELYETKLFDRSGSTISLTPAGEILYKYAKEILALYNQLDKDIGKITGLVKGSISIGASTTIGNYMLPAILADFKRTHTKIRMNLNINNTKRIVELLTSGTLDIGLVECEVSKNKVINESIVTDELCLIVPPLHPWAKRRVVSILELTKEPFIMREEGSGTRQVIEKYLAAHGIHINDMKITLVAGSTASIKESVENGLGISIVSKWALRKEAHYGTLKIINFKEERMFRSFWLLLPKNSVVSHSVDEFIYYIKSYPYDKHFMDFKS